MQVLFDTAPCKILGLLGMAHAWKEDTTEHIKELAKDLVAKTMPSVASTIADDTQRA